MAEFFDRWSPGQITLLVMTVGIAAAVIVFILAITHYQLRALADHTALERERAQAAFALRETLVRRNLPAAELRSALDALGLDAGGSPPAAADGELTAAILKGLMACGKGVSAGDIQATVAEVTAADPATQRAVAEVLDDAAENGYEGEQVFATVRAACQAARRRPEPAAEKREIDLQLESGYAAG
jgi:hypothetical protein